MLRGIFIRAFLVLAVPLALLQPFTGVLLYLWYSHARMNDFVWRDYQYLYGALLLAVATLVGYFIFELRRSPPRVTNLKLIILFWIWIALSTAFAASRDLAIPKLMQFSNIFVMTFLICAVANSEDRIRKLLYAAALAVGVLGSKGAIDFILSGGQAVMKGPGGMMNEENEYALALTMGVALLLVLARGEPRRWLKIAMYVMGIGCGITVVGTHSRSGVLGLAAAALLITIYSKRKVLGFIAIGLAAVILFAYGPKAAVERYETLNTKVTETDESVIGRLQAWETAFAMTKAHPLLGVGPLNFVYQFPYYSAYKPRAPHSAYIGLMAESGIPAMLTFVGILFGAIGQMWALRRQLLRYAGTARLGIYCLAIQVTLLVYMVPNFFINRQNQDLMYHLVGISAGLAILGKQRLRELRADEQHELMERYQPSLEPETVNA